MQLVSNWHAKVVVKSSLADLKKLTSASHCFALVWTIDTVFICKQFWSGLSSSSSSNCWIFFDDRHTDAKWPFFWHLLHVFLNAGHFVLLSWPCLRPRYLQVGSKGLPDFFFSNFFSKFDDLPPSLFLLRLLWGNFFSLNFVTLIL